MMGVFESRVPRKMFIPKKGEETGESIRLQNEKLYALYCSPDISRVIKPRGMRWVRKVVCIGAYRVLVGRPDQKTLLGKPGHSWEDNIKRNLQVVGWGHGLD